MKKWNLLKIAIIVLTVLLIAACDDDSTAPEEKNPHNDAFADVFIKKVKSPNGDKYGLVFYSGGEGLTECRAKAPDGTEYELMEFWKGAGNMRRHPKNTEMKGTMPQTGTYTFTLTFDDGVKKTLTDNLEATQIPAMTKTKVTHEQGTDEVSVSWKGVSGANNYMVKLTDKFKNKKKPIFNIKTLVYGDTVYSFNKNTKASPGWMRPSEPAAGDTCYLMVVAIKYENGFDPKTKDQNKQMNTVKPQMIIW